MTCEFGGAQHRQIGSNGVKVEILSKHYSEGEENLIGHLLIHSNIFEGKVLAKRSQEFV